MVIAHIVFLTIDKSKIIIELNLVSITLSGIREVLTGFIMGYMLNFIFYGISFAGTLIGFDMGLMMAEVMNPMQETSNNVVGEVIYYVSMMIFILINGHHYIIGAVVASFDVIPIAKFSVTLPVVQMMLNIHLQFSNCFEDSITGSCFIFLNPYRRRYYARVIPNIQVFL